MALGRQGAGQVHGDARLAHAALARGDGDHGGLPVREELGLLGPAAAQARHEGAALLVRHRPQDHLDVLHAGQRGHRAGDVGLDALAQGAALDGQQDRHRHGGVLDADVLQHADVLDRLADLRIHDVPQRGANFLGGGHGSFLR